MKRTRGILDRKRTQPTAEEEIFQSICKDVSENLDADITSIWFFDKTLSQIECQCCLDSINDSYSSGEILKKATFPSYFNSIIEYNFISAPNARTSQFTKELAEPYFEPKGILSLLDFTIHKDFEPVGIVCCENRRNIRYWSEDDKDYLRSIAALSSLHFRFS